MKLTLHPRHTSPLYSHLQREAIAGKPVTSIRIVAGEQKLGRQCTLPKFLPVVLGLCILVNYGEASGFTGDVVGVLDGDTIEVLHDRKAQRIRLHGINCP